MKLYLQEEINQNSEQQLKYSIKISIDFFALPF